MCILYASNAKTTWDVKNESVISLIKWECQKMMIVVNNKETETDDDKSIKSSGGKFWPRLLQ